MPSSVAAATANNARSMPVLGRSITLHTDQAQYLYSRTFERAASSVYKVSSVLQIFAKPDEVEAALGVVIGLLDNAEADMATDNEKLERLIANQAIEERPHYTSAQSFVAPVSSPLATRLVRLVAGLDKLVIAADTLWLYESFNDQQRNTLVQSWQSRLMRLNRRLVDIERRALRAARTATGTSEDPQASDEYASAPDQDGDGTPSDASDAAATDQAADAAAAEDAKSQVAVGALKSKSVGTEVEKATD